MKTDDMNGIWTTTRTFIYILANDVSTMCTIRSGKCPGLIRWKVKVDLYEKFVALLWSLIIFLKIRVRVRPLILFLRLLLLLFGSVYPMPVIETIAGPYVHETERRIRSRQAYCARSAVRGNRTSFVKKNPNLCLQTQWKAHSLFGIKHNIFQRKCLCNRIRAHASKRNRKQFCCAHSLCFKLESVGFDMTGTRDKVARFFYE